MAAFDFVPPCECYLPLSPGYSCCRISRNQFPPPTEESMFARFNLSISLSLLFAFALAANLSAQQHVVLSPTRSATVQVATSPDPGLIKIHSNLGKSTDAYDDGISWA